MLDQSAINRLNRHPTSLLAEAEMRRLQPDWNLSPTHPPVDGLAVMGLLQAFEEERNYSFVMPEEMEAQWLMYDKIPFMSEAEIKELLDRMEVNKGGTLEDLTGSMMEAMRDVTPERSVPDYWT